MSLPGITVPPGTPGFLADGHGIAEDDVYAPVRFGTGHSRARRRRTAANRVVSVSIYLEPAELVALDDWYWETLESGTLEFAALVAHQGPGARWWTARWLTYSIEMLNGDAGRLHGSLYLRGEPSVEGPNTFSLAMEMRAAVTTTPGVVPANVALAMEIDAGVTVPS